MHQPRARISALGVEAVAWDTGIEYPRGDLHLGGCILSCDDQGPHTDLGTDHQVVLEVEEPACHRHDEEHDGADDAVEADPRGFECKELKALTQIAQRHQRRQQDTQRERHRDEGEGRIEDDLQQHEATQSLADQLIDVAPEELHHHDEPAHGEAHHEERDESPEDILIYDLGHVYYRQFINHKDTLFRAIEGNAPSGEVALPAGDLHSSYVGFDGLAPESVMLPVVEDGNNLYRSSGESILLVMATYIGQRAYLYRFIQRSI